MSKDDKDLDQEKEGQREEDPAQQESSNGQEQAEEESDGQPEYQDGNQNEEDIEYDSLEREELVELVQERDKQIEELQQQLTEVQDKHLRKVAEVDNMKKRIDRERSEIRQQAKINALQDFLPINDDLVRTLNAAEGLEIDDKFLDGVQMVADKFENVLRQNGVERIDETMVPFDVDKHEAMMRQPADDEDVDSNTVLQILENGYRIGDRTIRHAKVIVSE